MDEAQGLSTRPVRKSIRLPRDAYAVSGSAWLLTMTTAERRSHFTDPVFAGAVAALLLEVSDARGVQIDLYCFMPDHAHVLAQVTTGDVLATIQAFKSLSTRLWHNWGGHGVLWQRSFHDHGLRTSMDYDRAVHYILMNPVEAGLSECWEAFAQIGGPVAGRL